MIKQSLVIANQTFKEIYQSKILLNILILGVAIAMAIYVSSEMTYGAAPRVGLDIGLGVLSLSSVGIAIFMGSTLIDKEVKNRTLYMIISRPVSRTSFYIGKMLGLSSILFINILLLFLFVLLLYWLVGGHGHYLIPWSALFIFVESLVMLFAVVFLSLLTNTILTVLFSLTLYIAGHAVESVRDTMLFKSEKGLSLFIDLYAKLMPNFSKFNIKSFVLYKGELSHTYLFSSLAYAFLWIFILGTISAWIMNKKDFS